MMKQRPERVAGAFFIDPIVFLLCRVDVTFNFLYRKPARWNEEFIQYFASSEVGIARTLRHHFCWISSSLWPRHITVPTVVALSSNDGIVPSPHVKEYLGDINTGGLLKTIYMEGLHHAGFLGSYAECMRAT